MDHPGTRKEIKIIGITGGIGSGKSIVSRILRLNNIPVYDTDSAAKQLMENDGLLQQRIKTIFGERAFKNGEPDRQFLAEEVFSKPEKLKELERLIHPAVFSDFQQWTIKQNHSIVAVESAILFKAKMDEKVNYTVGLIAPVSLRIKRVIERSGLSEAEIKRRIDQQVSPKELTLRCNATIINDEKHPVLPQVKKIIAVVEKSI